MVRAAKPYNFDAIPQVLKEECRWVIWRFEARDGKETKVPYQARQPHTHAKSTASATWGTFAQALAASKHADGIGFVLGDGWAGADFDDCIDLETGHILPWAQQWIESFASYTEVSPSRAGVKVFLRATALHDGQEGHKRGDVEAYVADRFFTITGWHLDGTPETVENRQDVLTAFSAHHFSAPRPESRTPRHDTQGPTLTLDDQVLLEKARSAKNGAKFQALERGDDSEYDGDESRGDQSFCNLLAFWTQDPEQIDRLVRQSGRYREKWDTKRGALTYGEQTILKALNSTTERYSPRRERSSGGTSDGRGADTGTSEEEAGSNDDPPDDPGAEKGGRGPSIAQQLVTLAEGCDFFHDLEGEPWVTFPVNGHMETCSLKSGVFKDWLEYRLHKTTGRNANPQAMQEALGILRGQARFDGPAHPVYVRLAAHDDGTIYLDLADEARRAVKITAQGWELVNATPVKFWRPKGVLPLPVPTKGGSIADLRAFVNVTDEEWPLLVAFMVGCFRAHHAGGHPVLAIGGEQGSGKTTLARIIRKLIDPNRVPVRAEPKDKQILAIAAKNSWLPTFDNLSNLSGWLSDALCRLSTGGGDSYRTHYENDEETLFDATRPQILTSIVDVASNSDLVDRTIFLSPPRIIEAQRREESALWLAFDQKRPGILGALLDAVACALERLPTTNEKNLPRMADFAKWVIAAERALPWEEAGTFLAAYRENRAAANTLALDASLVATAMMSLIQPGTSWMGTAKKLLEDLNKQEPQNEKRPDWPATPRKLSGAIKTIAPNLRAVGFTVPEKAEHTSGGNVWTFARAATPSSPDTPPDPSSDTQGKMSGEQPSQPSQHSPGQKSSGTETVNVGVNVSNGNTTFTPTFIAANPEKIRSGEGSEGSEGISPTLSHAPHQNGHSADLAKRVAQLNAQGIHGDAAVRRALAERGQLPKQEDR